MRRLRAFLFAVLLSGCATVSHGPQQRVMVSTPGAPHAECALTSATLGARKFITPEAINIPRSSEKISITCHKQCFHDATKTFDPVLNGEDLAVGGLIGGIGPVAIDAATGRAYNYTYDFRIPMKSNRRCAAHRKGFLQGDQKDFDNEIKDFNFDQLPAPLPETISEPKKSSDPIIPDNTKIK
jgi:hypothetical protein